MYKKVSTSMDFVQREREVLQFWTDNDVFQKSMDDRKEGETYTFYDGPPTANGKPHIGHVLTRVIKDMIPRYRTMKGYMVPRKAGWDTHGLPVELEVEKLLGLDGKEQIEEYGLEPFIQKCKESVWKYKGMWEEFSGIVGFWADMDDPYVTYHNNFIESEWWALKQIWDKGLLYKGFKIVPYCPRCGTPLSSHEVAQGYKCVKERSAVVRFKVVGEDAWFLAWTTTPWTLPSNVALCVNPKETYCKVKAADGHTYYMAKALLDTVLGKLATDDTPAYEILETYVGADLEHKEYEPLFDAAKAIADKQHKKGFFITCDNYVTMTDGTGIVHIAPAFGEDDAQVGRKYDLPFVQLVDGAGNMTDDTPYAGKFVKDADPLILVDLDKRGQLFDAPKFEHDYPFCWRCDTPLIYYARESWFIKMTAVREDLIRNNNTINWIPESIGKGRFGDWLENVQDWGISRNRYWGTPLNIWECSCGHQHAIGSIEELKAMSDNCPEEIELHRPFIDAVTLRCPECGGEMKRVPEVIDCWFDSGAMPFAQHHYPFCWRCDTPLIYYARESWFIKMTAVKDDLIRNNNTVNWIPESIGKGRFGDWLENVQDWGISRNRYWGTPLNIWECSCGHQHAIGSIEELKNMSDNCPDGIELHRPFIDAVTLRCPECGGEMKRVPEVIDCWFDSGAMPFAQHHYPFENKDLFEQQFPADFISEAVDQTSGWSYSLMAISPLIFNKAPFKNVIVLGHVQDENGQKMSKSKGNAVDPMEALQTYGADAIRWYFYTNSAPWLPNRFHGKAVQECQRKFMGTLWNTYAFFVLYANIDNFDATKYTLEYDKLSVMDKWLLSRLNSTVKAVDDNLANYRIPETARVLESFVDDMSNWYVRRSRERFWGKDMPQDKVNAYMTLHTALVTVAKLAAPMVPFMTEDIYRNLVCTNDASAPASVHLCDFPVANEAMIDAALEAKMQDVVDIVVLGRAARNGANCKNRQPLGKMFVQVADELDGFFTEIIAEELNVKEIAFTADTSAFMSYTFKPQLKTVGPKYGKQLGEIRQALTELDGNAAKATLDRDGALVLTLPSGDVTLAVEDLLIDTAQTEGYYTVSDKGITVALDTNLTAELIEEGFVREVVSKIQTMRKEAGFEVTDKITVYVADNAAVEDLLTKNVASLLGDVMATALTVGSLAGYQKAWNINGETVTLGVEKNT